MEKALQANQTATPAAERPPRGGLGGVALIFFGSLAIAILLSPPLFALIRELFPKWSKITTGNPESLLTGFDRIFSRVRMLSALLFLPFLLKREGLLSLESLRLRWGSGPRRHLLASVLLGIAMLGGVLALQVLALSPVAKAKADPSSFSWWSYALTGAILTAVLVSFWEEVLFRGYLQKVFQRGLGSRAGIMVGALFFSMLHFRSPPPAWDMGEPGTLECALRLALGQSAAAFTTAPGAHFLNLFLAGICLSLITLRTGTLWAAIGLHAGWVLVRSTYIEGWSLPGAQPGDFWGTTALVNGWVTTLPLLLLAGALLLSLRRQTR